MQTLFGILPLAIQHGCWLKFDRSLECHVAMEHLAAHTLSWWKISDSCWLLGGCLCSRVSDVINYWPMWPCQLLF